MDRLLLRSRVRSGGRRSGRGGARRCSDSERDDEFLMVARRVVELDDDVVVAADDGAIVGVGVVCEWLRVINKPAVVRLNASIRLDAERFTTRAPMPASLAAAALIIRSSS